MRRVAIVLLIYLAAAWVIVLGADWFRRTLALPELFETLLHGGLVAGVPLAALLAWKYPELGDGGSGPAAKNVPRTRERTDRT